MFRIVSTLCIFLFFATAYSQNFKEVKTADDVIENYLIAIGGAEKISKIKSVDIYCSLAVLDSSLMRLYLSKSVFFMNMKFRVLDVRMVYDFRKKAGWLETLGQVSDMDSMDERKSIEAVSSLMWDNYLNPTESGITYKFNHATEEADTTCYAVDITKNDSLLLTAYIDKVSFLKIRESIGKSIVSYGDFREISGFGVKMPFDMGGAHGDKTELKVTKYVLNVRIDPELVKRPKSKEK